MSNAVSGVFSPSFGSGGSHFPTASFGPYKFPVSRYSVKGGIRDHVHEFPHSPGGEPEKLGRKLYTVTMTAHFHDVAEFNAEFPRLWPTVLSYLRQTFEQQTTDDLMIPSIGIMKAYCVDWEQIADMERALSGEEVTLTFREDQDALLLGGLTSFGSDNIFALGVTVSSFAALADYFGEPQPSIFDQINDAVTAVQGAFDQADAFSNVVAGKLDYLSQLCSMADRDVNALQHPVNYQLLDALKNLWAASNELAKDITFSQRTILTFVVPRLMAIGDVSTAIFGDASHTLEILNMNPIEDAFAIPAGTNIRYLAPA